MWHPQINLVNTTLSQKFGDSLLKVSIYGSILNSRLYIAVVGTLFAISYSKTALAIRCTSSFFELVTTFHKIPELNQSLTSTAT